MMLKKMYFVIAVLLCVSIVSHAAVIITDDGTSRLRTPSLAQATGYDFTVGDNPLEVSALGVWDDAEGDAAGTAAGIAGGTPDGLLGDVIVRLFEQTSSNTGTLLASLTIAAGTNGFVDGEFRYMNLDSAVTLSANTTYQISTQFFNTGDMFHHFELSTTDQGYDYTTSSDVGSIVSRFGPLTVGTNPGTDPSATIDGYMNGWAAHSIARSTDHAFISGNMQYEVVPEPATMMLLGLGGMALIRKKIKA